MKLEHLESPLPVAVYYLDEEVCNCFSREPHTAMFREGTAYAQLSRAQTLVEQAAREES